MINENPPDPETPEPDDKPKRGFAAWTPEEREAARVKAAATRAANLEKEKKGGGTVRLETAEPRVVPKQAKGKAAKRELSSFDKEVLVKAMEMANVALDLTSKADERWTDGPMTGQSVYSLSREEISKLADAWFEVAKRYPVFGSFLVAGRTFSVWGDALFVSYVVVGKRVQIAAQLRQRKFGGPAAGPAQTGPARPPGGDDVLRQDDAGAAAPIVN